MYQFKDNSIFPVDAIHLVTHGEVVDHRIAVIERIVADHYGTTVHELDVFYKNSDAKLMCCFLLHQVLHYSISSLAINYKVYRQYLRNQVQAYYQKCLLDADFMMEVSSLIEAFLKNEETALAATND